MSFGILTLLLTGDFQTSLPLTTQSKNLLQSELGQTINNRVGGIGASQKQRSHSVHQAREVTEGQTTSADARQHL